MHFIICSVWTVRDCDTSRFASQHLKSQTTGEISYEYPISRKLPKAGIFCWVRVVCATLQNHLLHLLPPMATNYLLSGRGIYLPRVPAVQSDPANKPLVTRLSLHGSGIGCKRQRIPHCCDIQDSTYDIHMVCKHSACSCTQNSSAMWSYSSQPIQRIKSKTDIYILYNYLSIYNLHILGLIVFLNRVSVLKRKVVGLPLHRVS